LFQEEAQGYHGWQQSIKEEKAGCSCRGETSQEEQEQQWHWQNKQTEEAREAPSHLRYRTREAGESSERCQWWKEFC